jgi:hypothetical protein
VLAGVLTPNILPNPGCPDTHQRDVGCIGTGSATAAVLVYSH